MDVTGDRSKVRCYKEQYCIGTWNVRSMNQGIQSGQTGDGKSECRHSRISELKWTGMGEFNSDHHYIYYCRQESLRRNGVAITVNKRVRNAELGCSLKNDRMISVRFQGKPFNITVIQIFIFWGSKITADGDCSHEIKRRLLLGRKVMTNLDSILKSRDITLPKKVHLVKAMFFSSNHVWI